MLTSPPATGRCGWKPEAREAPGIMALRPRRDEAGTVRDKLDRARHALAEARSTRTS